MDLAEGMASALLAIGEKAETRITADRIPPAPAGSTVADRWRQHVLGSAFKTEAPAERADHAEA